MEEDYIYYFKKPKPTPEFTSFHINIRESSKITSHFQPPSLINPLPMDFAFMSIFSPYTAQCCGDFDRLFVPFRAVASDVYNKRPLILQNGDLGNAVRASMSFPFVFKPIEIDSILVYDGGIYNNFPIDIMKKDFAPDIIIGSNVASALKKPGEDNLMGQVENMVMQKTDYSIDEKEGILIEFDLKEFGLLDFPKADIIYRIGYEKTKNMADSIRSRIPRTADSACLARQRAAYKSQVPELIFDQVSVKGGNHFQQNYIRKQFPGHGERHTFSTEEAKQAYYRLLSDSKISELMPHAVYNDDTGYFTLRLQARINDNIRFGIGGYISSGSTNLIYLGARYRTLSLYSMDIDVNGQIGTTYSAGTGSIRVDPPGRIPLYLKFTGAIAQIKYFESNRLFYRNDSPTFITQTESYVKLTLGTPLLTAGIIELTGGYGVLTDKYYPSNDVDYSRTNPDKSRYKLLEGAVHIEKNTLNNFMFPVSGNRISVTGSVLYGTAYYYGSNGNETPIWPTDQSRHAWMQLTSRADYYFQAAAHFTLGMRSEIVLSGKKFFDNYTATIIQAPAFTPTPHSQMVFNESLRATQYIAAGILPIWKIASKLQLRSEFYGFAPFYPIKRGPDEKPYYGKFMHSFEYLGEVSLVYDLPFASVSLYINKYSYPRNNWNFGVGLGFLLYNARFIE
ncbi:MAG: patatin-like phospholipase family protein, partial [Coprobacter sp.]|nr:patatin-like phospholipase family protein [Coprobacter sp.]